MSEHHKAFYTVEESEVGNLYYFAPLTRAAGPFKEQRHVEAVIDIDADGCLAGVELIDKMPAPPKVPPMTAPADSRISDEMNGQSAGHPIEQLLIDAYVRGVEWCEENPLDREYRFKAARDYADKALTVLASLAPQQPLTELRERRAQAVAVIPLDRYLQIHDAAMAAYEAATPPDYRYSATALRKAVDAALDAFAVQRRPK